MAKQVIHAGPEELAATQQAAVEAAVQDTLGLTVDPQGNLVPPPKVAEFYAAFVQMQADITGLSGLVTAQAATITQQAASIAQFTALLNGKASADSLASVRQNLTTLTSTVGTKADATTVAQQFQATYDLDATQSAAIKAAQDLLATDGGLLANLLASQSSLSNLVTGLRTDVDSKAPATTVSVLTGQVTGLRNAQNDSTTGLVATKAIADAATTALSTLTTTTLPGLKTDIGNRLRKDQPDSTPFQLGVPLADGMDKAVRKAELLGGIQQPFRFFVDVQTAPVGAYLPAGSSVSPAISDAGLGQTLSVTGIFIKNTGTTAVATTIALTGKNAAGVTVFTYSVALLVTAVPAVGKLVDLLAIAPSLPADVPLTSPVTFTATASGGKFEIRLEGKLK